MTSFEDLSPKVQLITMGVLAVVLAGAAEFTLLAPMRAADAKTEAKLTKVQQENLKLRPWMGRLTMVRAQEAQLAARWQATEALLPPSAAPDAFLHELQAAAREANVSIRKVGEKPPAQDPLYQEAPFTLQIDGSFAGVLNFFDRVRALPRIVSIKHWTLRALPPGASSQAAYFYRPDETVTADCDVSTFYSPAPVAADSTKPAEKSGRGGGK